MINLNGGRGKHGIVVDGYGPSEGGGEDGNRNIGCIEPAGDKPAWIAWVTMKGDLILYTQRSYENGDTGAVIGEPLRILNGRTKRRIVPTPEGPAVGNPEPEGDFRVPKNPWVGCLYLTAASYKCICTHKNCGKTYGEHSSDAYASCPKLTGGFHIGQGFKTALTELDTRGGGL
jgi:hypothetical protein